MRGRGGEELGAVFSFSSYRQGRDDIKRRMKTLRGAGSRGEAAGDGRGCSAGSGGSGGSGALGSDWPWAGRAAAGLLLLERVVWSGSPGSLSV